MQRLLPPRLFMFCGLGSAVVGPLIPGAGPVPLQLRLVGFVVLVLGLALTVAGARLFDRVGTNITTFNEPDQLVSTGPFHYSRNPMYLGFVIALVGIAEAVGTLTALLGPLVFAVVADRWYIPFEERRMAARFGPAYEQYRSVVLRWLGRRGVARS